MRLVALTLAAVLMAAVTGLTPVSALPPGDLTVDRTDDSAAATACTVAPNDCSLRGAILHANQTPGPEVVVLAPSGIYNLGIAGAEEDAGLTGDLDIHSDVSIIGQPGGFPAGINAQSIDRIFDIHAENDVPDISVLLRNLTLTGGAASGSDPGGGAIFDRFGTLTIDKVLVFGNTANYGAAIHALNGDITISRSTIRDNESTSGPGTVYNNTGRVSIDSTTISGNTASDAGGGIANFGGRVTIVNSTISGNSAGSDGGGIFTNHVVTLTNVTVAQNVSGGSGGGIFFSASGDPEGVSLENTVLSGNVDNAADDECHGEFTSLGHNLIQQVTAGCQFIGDTSTDIVNTPAQLANLLQTEGWNATHDPLAGSPLIDAVPLDKCPSIDQRLRLRPFGALCDVGAVESEAGFPVTLAYYWGDLICDQTIDINDALPALAFAAGVLPSLPAGGGCPALPDMVYVEDPELQGFWGDVNCDGLIDGQDALLILSFLAELDDLSSVVCPGVSAEVTLLVVPQ